MIHFQCNENILFKLVRLTKRSLIQLCNSVLMLSREARMSLTIILTFILDGVVSYEP